jgi:hypothetical protein
MEAKLTGGATGHSLTLPLSCDVVDPFNRLRVTHLREALVAGRREKATLEAEIASPNPTPEKKQQVILRYSILLKELWMIGRELREIRAAIKQAENTRHP